MCFLFGNLIKIQQIEYFCQYHIKSQVNVKVRHVLSIEIEEYKREFIKAAHTPPGEQPEFCMFDDVEVLEKMVGFCYICNKEHDVSMDIDAYFVGPSCKNISYENTNSSKWANCYTDHDGCSGATYRLGVKKGIEMTCPAIAFYENTKGVADSVRDPQGVKHRPRIEAQFENHVASGMFIYVGLALQVYIYNFK